jgi:hypothetical protein
VVAARVVDPELLLGLDTDVLLDDRPALEVVAAQRAFSMRIAST